MSSMSTCRHVWLDSVISNYNKTLLTVDDKRQTHQMPLSNGSCCIYFCINTFRRERRMTAHLIPPQFRMTRFSASIFRPPYSHLHPLPTTSLKLEFHRPNFTSTQTSPSYFSTSFLPNLPSSQLFFTLSFKIPLTFPPAFPPFQPLLRNLCCKSFPSKYLHWYHSLCNHIPLSTKYLKIGSEMHIFVTNL